MHTMNLKDFLKPRSDYRGDPYAKASRRALKAYAKSIYKRDATLFRGICFELGKRMGRARSGFCRR